MAKPASKRSLTKILALASLLLIVLSSACILLHASSELLRPGTPFSPAFLAEPTASKLHSRLWDGCYCCSGSAAISHHIQALENYVPEAPKQPEGWVPMEFISTFPSELPPFHLRSLAGPIPPPSPPTLPQELLSSLQTLRALPGTNHLVVDSHRHSLQPHLKVPEPLSNRYSEDRSAWYGESVYGMLTSDTTEGWDGLGRAGKDAILLIAMADGAGGGLKSWGVVAGLLEWHKTGTGFLSPPLERPIVFLFANDTQGVDAFLELYETDSDLGVLDSAAYHRLSPLTSRPKIMAALSVDIPSLLDGEHYGPLALRSAPSTESKDRTSNLHGLAHELVAIQDSASLSTASPSPSTTLSWSSLLRALIGPLRVHISRSSESLSDVLKRHNIPSLDFHLPRHPYQPSPPYFSTSSSISELAQVLDSTLLALSAADGLPAERRVETGWLAAGTLWLGATSLAVAVRRQRRRRVGCERYLWMLAVVGGASSAWGPVSLDLPPVTYAAATVALSITFVLWQHLHPLDALLSWLYFPLAAALPFVVLLHPLRTLLVMLCTLPLLLVSACRLFPST